jgi:hypothetical protein
VSAGATARKTAKSRQTKALAPHVRDGARGAPLRVRGAHRDASECAHRGRIGRSGTSAREVVRAVLGAGRHPLSAPGAPETD